MKLSRLRVRGLRSYVSEVEIDLARLGEEGLFAIFGPTGSGKSTILDGIFLALFGRCPRGEASECVSAGAFELGAVADSALGGLHRPPSTLSGGETFLVSLALALALSERIQLAGRARFDFFFLDEGFGGLDAVTLDAAVSALERLRGPHRVIGMITHLAAIEERMPRKLRVEPGRAGAGASMHLEIGEPIRESARAEPRPRRKSQQIPQDPGDR